MVLFIFCSMCPLESYCFFFFSITGNIPENPGVGERFPILVMIVIASLSLSLGID